MKPPLPPVDMGHLLPLYGVTAELRAQTVISDDRMLILIHPSQLPPEYADQPAEGHFIWGLPAVISDLGPGVVIRP